MQQNSNLTIRPDIQDALIEHAFGGGEFIGLKAMPIFGVAAKGGTFAKLAFSEIQTTAPVGARAAGANYNRINHQMSSDTYTCEEFGYEEPVDDGEAAVIGNYFDAEVAAAVAATYYAKLAQEARIAALLFDDTTTFGSYKTNGTDWTTAASGTPISPPIASPTETGAK